MRRASISNALAGHPNDMGSVTDSGNNHHQVALFPCTYNLGFCYPFIPALENKRLIQPWVFVGTKA